MRQWVKKSVRYVLALIILVIIILSIQLVVLPRIVQHLILSRLAAIGLSEAALEVRSCSLSSAELANVELGQERCACIGALTADYSLGSLLRGKVNKVQVTGGQLVLRIRDGKIELGELAQISVKSSQQATEAPFDSIELRACTLSIDWPQKRICIPCEGFIRNKGAGWIMHDLHLNFQGTPLQLKVSLYTRGESLTLSLQKQDIDLQALMTALPLEGFSIPARLAGNTGFELRGDISTSNANARLRASLSDAWCKTALADFPLDAEGVNCEIEVELERLSRLKNITAKLTAETVEYAGIPASNVIMNLEKFSDNLLFSGDAQGEGWNLKNFSAILPAQFPAQNTQMNQAEVVWELEGKLPEPAARKLASKGFDVSGLGKMDISGLLSTTVSKEPDIDLTKLQITLAPGTVNIDQGRLVFQGLSGILKLRGNYSKKEAHISLLPDSSLIFDRANFENIKLGKTSLNLKEDNDKNIADFKFNENGLATSINLEASTDCTEVQTTDNRLIARLDGIHLSLDTSFSPEQDKAGGKLIVDTIKYYPGYQGLYLDLQNAILNVDSSLNGTEEKIVKTTLTFDEAVLLNEKSDVLLAADKEGINPISGSFDLDSSYGEFQSKWSIQNGAILSIQGNLDLNEEHPSVSLKALCDELHLDEEQAAIKMLAASTGIIADGDLSLEAGLNWRGGYFTPRLEITTANTSLLSNRYEVKAEGIVGSVVLNSLFPISTPGNQILKIKNLKLGKLEFTDGLIALRLEKEPMAAFIERTEWQWMGGHLYTHALRIDPNLPRVDFKLFAEDLELQQLLDIAFGQRATGRGKLYGMIPVSLSPSSLADIRLGEGFLYSTSGEGWWKLADEASQSPAWKVLEKQLGPKFEGASPTADKESLLKGLLDFAYSRFKIDFVEAQGGLTARITTQGHSRNKKIPVEFEEIVLDIPRFDENLRKLIAIKSALDVNINRAREKLE
jgi:hypothetical protein